MISQFGAEDELKQVEWVACIDRRIFKPYKNAVFNQAATLCARDYGLDSQSIIDCASVFIQKILGRRRISAPSSCR